MKGEEVSEGADDEAGAPEEAVLEEEEALEPEEEEAAQPTEAKTAAQLPPDQVIPPEIILERPGGAAPVTAQTDALGTISPVTLRQCASLGSWIFECAWLSPVGTIFYSAGTYLTESIWSYFAEQLATCYAMVSRRCSGGVPHPARVLVAAAPVSGGFRGVCRSTLRDTSHSAHGRGGHHTPVYTQRPFKKVNAALSHIWLLSQRHQT